MCWYSESPEIVTRQTSRAEIAPVKIEKKKEEKKKGGKERVRENVLRPGVHMVRRSHRTGASYCVK